MYAYTGPPNKRVSVHSRDPRPDNVPEDWVIDHIDRDIQQHGRIRCLAVQRLQRQTSGFRVLQVSILSSRRIASELKARAVFTLATSARARGRNRFGNLLRTQVAASGPKPATCCSLATNPRQALCCL
jgi:hypothetical protein